MPDLQPTLEGESLRLRPMRADDHDALFAVASDLKIWAKHPAHDRWRPDVFRQFFDEGMASGAALTVIDKASDRIIGHSRFVAFDDEVEIGWTFLDRAYWGGARNREMKRLMLVHILRFFPRAVFRVGEHNIISRRAMEKIGGRLTDRIEQVERGGALVTHVIYEIDRESFARGPLSAAG